MDREAIRATCLALPGVTETVQWGDDIVFKVGGKMFAVAGVTADQGVSFKCDPETFYELQERSGVRPAPYLARAQWLLVDDDRAIAWPELKTLLELAYAIVRKKLPKRAQAEATGPKATPRAPKRATPKAKKATRSAKGATTPKKKATTPKKATQGTKGATSVKKKLRLRP